MRIRGEAITLYVSAVCWQENCHFGKSRHLSDLLASLLSQSPQKLPLLLFKSFGIAHKRHEHHLLLRHCCHSHIILLKHKSFYTIVNITM